MLTFKKLWKISSVVLLALILSGCTKTVIKYVPTYIDKPIVCNVTDPEAQNMLKVKLKKVFSDKSEWWITASDEDYKKVSVNNGRIKKYMRDLKDTNTELRDCMKPKKES